MISLLLAIGLGQVPDVAPVSRGPQEVRAPLQSCESTPEGWVCNYQMPAVILRGVPPGTVVLTEPPVISVPVPSTVSPSGPPVEVTSAEADRQARLIARCADASWLSLCLPDDRDEAMRTALAGADMSLVWEVRNLNVCAPGPATAEAPADSN